MSGNGNINLQALSGAVSGAVVNAVAQALGQQERRRDSSNHHANDVQEPSISQERSVKQN